MHPFGIHGSINTYNLLGNIDHQGICIDAGVSECSAGQNILKMLGGHKKFSIVHISF